MKDTIIYILSAYIFVNWFGFYLVAKIGTRKKNKMPNVISFIIFLILSPIAAIYALGEEIKDKVLEKEVEENE